MVRAIPRIPPLPLFTVLIDREDGTEWVLSHTDDEGTVRVTLNDEGLERGALPPRTDYVKADHYGLGDGARLFVRGGRLGLEITNHKVTTPVWTREGVVRETYEIVKPSNWTPLETEDGPSVEVGAELESLI